MYTERVQIDQIQKVPHPPESNENENKVKAWDRRTAASRTAAQVQHGTQGFTLDSSGVDGHALYKPAAAGIVVGISAIEVGPSEHVHGRVVDRRDIIYSDGIGVANLRRGVGQTRDLCCREGARIDAGIVGQTIEIPVNAASGVRADRGVCCRRMKDTAYVAFKVISSLRRQVKKGVIQR